MTNLSLVPDDPTCHCGYRRSDHGVVPHACSRFSRSAFFNMATEDMAAVEKYAGTKPLATKKGRR